MEPAVNPQLLGKLPVGEQRFAEHVGKENGRGVILPGGRDLDRYLEPVIVALDLLLLARVFPRLWSLLAVYFCAKRAGRLLDLRLDAYDGLRAVGEADARAAVGAGKDARLCGQRAELVCLAAVWADGRREGEG